ncbi:MAG TPA: anti-sigma factor [Ramlibacter sp.]|nr:anti-sigma factor [Ramlibacter sp.]
MRYAHPDLVDRLASAYVLGTLRGGARRRFERLRRDRSDVQLAIAQWESRLGRLAQSVPPLRPSGRVWAEIKARTRPAPAPAAAPARGRWWLPAGFGLGGVLAGAAFSVLLLLSAPSLLFTPDQVAMRSGQKLPQSYVGLLTDAQGNGKLLASSLRHGRTLTIKVIGPIEAPREGRLVLWAQPAQGAPFVLGNVPLTGSAASELPGTSEQLLSRVGKLFVTVETAAAPAAPSGTPVYTGNCAKLW